jgi:predicted GTPase
VSPELATSSLAAVAHALDPEASPAGMRVLYECGEQLGHRFRDGLRDRMQRIAAAVEAVAVRVAFAGHFSCGKSTLLNSLIGRDLLPTDDNAETGVPCVIRGGRTDRVYAVTGGSTEDLAFGRSAIARVVSLDPTIAQRRDVDWVVVTLATGPVPADVLWIDLPGVNDSDEMTKRAKQVVGTADVVVWVISSRQPLATTEQEFLAEYIGAYGAQSVVFVLNAFLQEDTQQEWERFESRKAVSIARRTAEFMSDMDLVAPEQIVVSARASTANPAGFGGPQIRELLAGLHHPDHPRIRAVRLARAAGELRELESELAELATDQARERTNARLAAEETTRIAELNRLRFVQDIQESVTAALQRGAELVAEGIGTLVNSLAKPVRATDHYIAQLNTVISEALTTTAETVWSATTDRAVRHGQHEPDGAVAEALVAKLNSVVVNVDLSAATKAVNGGRVVGGGLVGLAGGPVGAAAGAALGQAAVGRLFQAKALATISAVLQATGTTAATELLNTQDDIIEMVIARCCLVTTATVDEIDPAGTVLADVRALVSNALATVNEEVTW